METNSQQYKEVLKMQIEESYGKIVYSYTVHLKCADLMLLIIIMRFLCRWHFGRMQMFGTISNKKD